MEPVTDPRSKAGQTKRSLSKAAFLSSADDVFVHHSYDEATVEDIAKASNRTPKTFYTIFQNKASWAASVIDSYFDTRSTSLDDSMGRLIEINKTYPTILKSVTELRLENMQYEEIVPETYQDINRNIRFGQWKGEYAKTYEPQEYGAYILDSVCALGGETDARLIQRVEMAIGSICLRKSI